MEWKVLYDKVLVKRHAPDEMIAGMAVPDAAKQEKNTGIVLRTGRGRQTVTGNLAKLQLEVGMEVVFSKFGGTELVDGKPDIVILREDEILAYRWPPKEKQEDAKEVA